MKTSGKTWQQPWRYTESIAIVVGLIFVGFALQLTLGKFSFPAIFSPVNWIIAGVAIVFPLVFSIWRKTSLYQWFSGVPFSVSLTGSLLVLGLLMGLTPQLEQINPHDKNIFSLLGFHQMTSSWAFVFVYFVTLLSLGALIIRRLITFKIRDYVFYLNHIGLWLLLFAAGFGSADLRRYVMYVNEGETQWQVYNRDGVPLELPIAIQLNDFQMEEYPPKLIVLNRKTGKTQYFRMDEKNLFNKQEDKSVIGMTLPEPKRFASDIDVYTKDGKSAHALLEVNKPLTVGNWMVYQYGYDNQTGSASSYSSFELVYDPWKRLVYAGIALFAAGATGLILKKPKTV